MEKVKLNEVTWFQEGPGVRNTQYTESGVKLLNVANLVNGKVVLSNTSRFISEDEAFGKYKHFLCDDGDLIIASSGIKVEYLDKKMGFVTKDMLPLCMNTSTIRFKVKDKNQLDIKYLMYFFKSNIFKDQIQKLITGSAQLNYGPSHLNKVFIKMNTMNKQKEIVNKLDKITNMIENQEKMIKKYDDLVKSQFIEMFGDRLTNTKQWQEKDLKDCVDFYNGKAHEQVVDKNGQYILVTSRCIASDMIDYRKTNALLFPLQKNDITMVMSDVPNGKAFAKCMLIDEDNKFTLNQRICCLRNYEFNPIYLLHLLNRHEYFLKFDDGNSQTNLRKNDLLGCNIIIPPIELQNQFADFVKHIDKLKFTIKESIEKLNLCYQSLMKEYFE